MYFLPSWNNYGISLIYNSVDPAHHEIFRSNVGKGGINKFSTKTYAVGTQTNRLDETVLLSPINISSN